MKNSYVILIPSLSRGGAESMAYQYGKYLESRGHLVKFLLIEKRVDDKYKDINKIVVESPSILKSVLNLRSLDFEKDTIFISLIPFYTIAFMLSRLLRAQIGIKVIYTVHNNLEMDFGKDFISKVVKSVYKKLLFKSSNVYAVSRGLNNSLSKAGIQSKLLINRITHKYTSVRREFSENINFLMVGRLNRQKDYISAIKYFNILKLNGVQFNVDIHGEGEEELPIREELKKYNLEEYISIKPYEQNIEKVFAKREYQALLLTSIYEGFGLVLLEAISKEMFVIGRDCDYGPSEIINPEVGFLLNHNFNDSDVLSSIEAMREHYFGRSSTSFYSTYSNFVKKSEDSWTQLESYQ